MKFLLSCLQPECPRRRSPRGGRGLKSAKLETRSTAAVSLSSRRAWIEISRTPTSRLRPASPSSRRAWIEIRMAQRPGPLRGPSLSSRRAWIEIRTGTATASPFSCRSPHGERGLKSHAGDGQAVKAASPSSRRAWIEIFASMPWSSPSNLSPSSRRAWIEIPAVRPDVQTAVVALLAEGVD